MNEIDIVIGKQVKKYRKAAGLTMEELGKRISKSKSTVSKYESGEIPMDISTLFEISAVLSVHYFQLLEPCCEEIAKNARIADTAVTEKVFIYYYDGRSKRVRRGVIFIIGGSDAETRSVLLNMNVGEKESKTGVEYIVPGKMTTFDTFTCFSFEQQNGVGDASVYAYKPFGSATTAMGIMSGVFKNPISPGSTKVILSYEEQEINEGLKRQLVFSSEEIKQIKRLNMLLIGNLY